MNSQLKTQALGLCSGGLDSILSALVLREQGIMVEWITFETPFFSSEKARRASLCTGIPLRVQNITRVYLEMLKNPRCGYGHYMNPCLDCHALMFKLAGQVMKAQGFAFLFSGEVLGQRPMSQTRNSLRYVEKNSGFEGYILRPLSAQKLPETLPEKQGLIRRDLLLGISGRGRKDQMALAEKFGLSDYPVPAGGCLLTDKGYAARLKDLLDHKDDDSENALHLLKYGRHFRLPEGVKLIVGRTQADNENMIRYHNPEKDAMIKMKKFPGPAVLIPGNNANTDTVKFAAAVCAGYSKAPKDMPVEVSVITRDKYESVQVTALLPDAVRDFLL